MRRFVLCGVLAFAALGSSAMPSGAVPAGFAFLEVPTGARAAALGGAYSTLAHGGDAAFWNPAGLQGMSGLEVAGGHAELIGGLRHDHFVLAGPALGGGLAASLRALYSEPIEERDEQGNLIGSFGAHDLEFGLAYGRQVAPGVTAGVSAQIVRERIANASTTTHAFGAGAAWEPAAMPSLRLAASMDHLGADGHYLIDGVEGQAVPLPTSFQAGVSYGRTVGYGLGVRAALEGRATRGRAGVGLMGLEIANPGGAAVRAGLRINDDTTGFSMGAGYGFPSLQLDYAWVPWKLDLGDTHRISFSSCF